MIGSRTLIGVLMALGLIAGACGGGDSIEPDAPEAAGDGNGTSDVPGAGMLGTGTMTFGGQSYEFDTVACGTAGDEIGVTAAAGTVNLVVQGSTDDPQVVVLDGQDQFTANPREGDGDFSFDGSRASGDLEFTGANSGEDRHGTFELTCPGA